MTTEFSASDRVKALVTPLTCCLPTCRLVDSPSTEDLTQNNTGRDWYSQSRPSPISRTGRGGETGLDGNWEDGDARSARREADLMSLHEAIQSPASSNRRRRLRGRGGDISGSGSSEGSGLTRWTLFISWWKGRGAIRLDDSDDEDQPDRIGVDTFDDQSSHLAFNEAIATLGDGESDARPLAASLFGGDDEPHAPPPLSDAGDTEYYYEEENEEQREARKARRRARRRAKELGLSLEEFDGGAVAEPEELPETPLLEVPQTSGGGSRNGKSRRSKTNSTSSSGSRDRDATVTYANQGPVPGLLSVTEQEVDGGDDLFAVSDRSSRKSRRNAEGTDGSSSASGDSRRRGSATSGGSGRRSVASTSQTSIPATQVPLPSSPPTSHDPSRPRHRSRASISSTSTSSSAGQRKSKRALASPLPTQSETYESPLEVPLPADIQYYQDEYGQLHAVPATGGQWFVDEAGQQFFVPQQAIDEQQYLAAQTAEPQQMVYPSPLDFSLPPSSQPSQDSYAHIGALPTENNETSGPADSVAAEVEVEELASHTTPSISQQTPDPIEFLKALKKTKLPTPTPTILSKAAVAPSANVEEEHENLLNQWEGLGKGAMNRSTWEGAGEVEGLEGSHWRQRSEEEDESE
ncbi:hypothetical protein T439DRAFT_335690 [Meredithblackwellia eburnea MCA 4105]